MNEHEVGRVVDFAISHPAIRGINFQLAFHVGRHLQHDALRSITIPDILELIAAQTVGRFVVGDFIPVPCCFPTCNSVTDAFVDGDQVVPLPRIVNVYEYLDYLTNRAVPDFSLEIRGALEGLWSSSSVAGRRSQSRSSHCRVRPAASRTRCVSGLPEPTICLRTADDRQVGGGGVGNHRGQEPALAEARRWAASSSWSTGAFGFGDDAFCLPEVSPLVRGQQEKCCHHRQVQRKSRIMKYYVIRIQSRAADCKRGGAVRDCLRGVAG